MATNKYITTVTGALSNYSFEEPILYIKDVWMNRLFPAGTSNKKKVAFLTLGATIALVCRTVYRASRVPKHLRHIPSAGYFTLLRSLLTGEDPTTRTRTTYGPVIKKGNGIYLANFPLNWTVMVSSPTAAKQVLMKTAVFPKSPDLFHRLGDENPVIKFFGFENVLLLNGDKWKQQRKVMNPAFHRAMPVQLFGQLMQKGFKNIEQQELQVPIARFFQNLTLDALALAGFGFDFHSLDDPDSIWTKTYEGIRLGLQDPFTFLFPNIDWLMKYIIPGRRRLDESVDKLNDLLNKMAQEKRRLVRASIDSNTPEGEKDLLTLMLEAEMRGEGTTTDEELRANLAIFFFAGHETTANAMSFCLYNLAMHKDIQDKARQEVLKVLGDEPVDVLPRIEDLREIPYIDMVLKENLRRFGPITMLIERKCVEDYNLNGVFIPKDTPVLVETHSLHHNPDVWENPEHFDPERFAPGGEHDSRKEAMTWIPFGSGSRMCLGMNFSMAEQRTFLVMLLRKYEWELPLDSPHRNGIKIGNVDNVAPESLEIKFRPRY